MRKFILMFILLILSIPAAYSALIEDVAAPEVNLQLLDSNILLITAEDKDSGISKTYVNGVVYTGARGQSVEYALKEDNQLEMIQIYSEDYAGNKSDIHVVVNPFYTGYEEKYVDDAFSVHSLKDKVIKINRASKKLYPVAQNGNKLYFALSSKDEYNSVLEQLPQIVNTRKYRCYYIDVKDVTLQKSFISSSDKADAVVQGVDEEVMYTKYGYLGKLRRVVNTIKTKENTISHKYYTDYIRREYTGLKNSEMTFIPKTVTDKGTTFYLSDVVWVNNGDDIDEPTEIFFTAHATYSRNRADTLIEDYKTTLHYAGSASKLREKSTVYAFELRHEKELQVYNYTEIIQLRNIAIFIISIFVLILLWRKK